MKWKKLGKVFDPRDQAFRHSPGLFAQSPQALVFDEFLRIYFSTRKIDLNGKFLSHVSFVDTTKDLSKIIELADRPVIDLGELGCFDEHGIFPFSVLRHGNQIYGYTCGWTRRQSVSVDTGIGLSVSKDQGLSFSRLGKGPILSASPNEPFLVGDGFVRFFEGVFHMWYIFGMLWKQFCENGPAERVYKIGHAVSEDGIKWRKNEGIQIIPDKLGEFESQALPSVAFYEDRYHMCFCYRESYDFRKTKGRGYRLGYAFSKNLVDWERADDILAIPMGDTGEWDSDMQCYPHLFECDKKLYLLYNGNEFGRFGFGGAVLEK